MIEALIAVLIVAINLIPSAILFNMFKNFQHDRAVGKAEFWAEQSDRDKEMEILKKKIEEMESTAIAQIEWEKKLRDAEDTAHAFLDKVKL